MIGRLRWLRLAVGLLLIVGLIAYLTPSALLVELKDANPGWLLAAATAIIASSLIGSYALFLLISRDRPLQFRAFLGVYWLSWGVGLVVPGQVGDVATLTALLQRRGMGWPTGLGRTLLDKLISLAVLGGFAAWGLFAWLPSLLFAPATAVAIAVGAILIGAAIWWLFWPANCTDPDSRPILASLRTTAREMAQTASQHAGRTAANFVLTVLKFGCVVLAYWCVFRALGQDQLEYFRALPLVAASALVAYVPVSLNGLGTVEFAGIVLFGAAGIAKAPVLSAYLLLRVMVMTIAWLPASVALLLPSQSANQSLGESERHPH